MRKMTIVLCAIALSFPAYAVTVEVAKVTAQNYLKAEVNLDQESNRSYFFTTGLEADGDTPCVRGVTVNKKSGQVVEPTTDTEINIYFQYADTSIDGSVVTVCAN
jgi:hypothetical protein